MVMADPFDLGHGKQFLDVASRDQKVGTGV